MKSVCIFTVRYRLKHCLESVAGVGPRFGAFFMNMETIFLHMRWTQMEPSVRRL